MFGRFYPATTMETTLISCWAYTFARMNQKPHDLEKFFWQKWLTICICWYSNHPVSENFEPYWNMNLQAKSRYVSGFQEPKARHLMMPGGWFRIKSFIRVPCICLNISWLLRTCSRDFYKTKILDLLAGCLEKVPKTCSQMVPWWWFTIVQSKQSP